ncbi:MAG TPA: TonB-dependent receptor plug domain-containing protein, partial [Polyangiales bacterium]|nr:TonB-dependent receptor plug domain-containing protein [Polyangiales bacterium]
MDDAPSAQAVAAANDSATLIPPVLEHLHPADYPPSALAGATEADVALTLTLDASGSVTDATVIDVTIIGATPVSADGRHQLEENARNAALAFRFAPARRGDTPVPARIRFDYQFRIPAPGTETEPRVAAPVHAAVSGTATSGTGTGTDVLVKGKRVADRMRESAEAVKVVETDRVKQESHDLGDVLAREPGVGVRRSAGLGSEARISLNGLTDDQVRFFVDEVPLEYAGYPFGMANLPVNTAQRIEIYSGVVPIRFGADALGGAINVVTPGPRGGAHATASYQAGSYGEQRATLSGQLLHEPTGLYVGTSAFLDLADNDYPIDVTLPNEVGRPEPARTHRFHDHYRASGAFIDAGWVRRPWADRLLVRGFVAETQQDLQHNAFMTVPYGGVTFGARTLGGNVRYQLHSGDAWTVNTVNGYAMTRSRLLDVDDCAYDWTGRCIVERRPGEIEPGNPRDSLVWQHALYSRTRVEWELAPHHRVLLAISPSFVTRTGDEREQSNPDARDPLAAQRELLSVVNGLELTSSMFADRIEHRMFFKQYLQFAWAEEEVSEDTFVRRDRQTHRYGFGDALRFRITDYLYAKASYEWATRLPRPDEVFGDNRLLLPYLELRPEKSHNLNVGIIVSVDGAAGQWRGELTGFYREADELIVRLSEDIYQFYRNVFSARSLGFEARAGWTAKGQWLVLDLNGTYQSFRNTADEGLFAPFEGDRIPNRPWLFVNAALRLQARGLFAASDQLALL